MMNIYNTKNNIIVMRWKDNLIKMLQPLEPYWQKIQPIIEIYYTKFINLFYSWERNKRILFCGSVIVLVFLLWYIIFYISMDKERRLLVAQINNTKQTIISIEHSRTSFLAGIHDDPNQSLQYEIDALNQNVQALKKEIMDFTNGQASSSKMIRIIKDKIDREEKITLIRIAGLAANRIIPPSTGTTRIGLDNLPHIYEYPIELEFESDYFTTINFLAELEKEWRVFWDNLTYSVLLYPNARVMMRIHVLHEGDKWNEN